MLVRRDPKSVHDPWKVLEKDERPAARPWDEAWTGTACVAEEAAVAWIVMAVVVAAVDGTVAMEAPRMRTSRSWPGSSEAAHAAAEAFVAADAAEVAVAAAEELAAVVAPVVAREQEHPFPCSLASKCS